MNTTHDPTGEPPRPDTLERVAAAVADLDSPFYDEERDRDVWNEACAVGFQLMLWGIPVVAAVLLWTMSTAALVPVAAMAVPWMAGGLLTVAYARHHAVDPAHAETLAGSPIRMVLFGLVMATLASGVLRLGLQVEIDGALGSVLRGAAQGGSLGLLGVTVWAVVVAVRERRRRGGAA